jgi:hypothetical protein
VVRAGTRRLTTVSLASVVRARPEESHRASILADDFNTLLMSARNPRRDSEALYRFFERNARFIAP